MNLNRTQMLEVEATITDAYDHVMSQFIGENSNRVRAFLISFTCSTSFYLAFTPQGFKQLLETVFGQADVREFVLRLSNSFHARFGDAHASYKSLLDTLVWSYNQREVADAAKTEYAAIPQEILTRLPLHADIQNLLVANKWLVTLAVLNLYLRMDKVSLGIATAGRGRAAEA